MRKPFIAGNWKMNHPTKPSKLLLEEFLHHGQRLESILHKLDSAAELDIAIFPPSVYLKDAQEILTDSSIHWGTQNVSAYDEGAYTGEISAKMLNEFGCDYVLVGHSERRCLYDELELDQYVLDQIVAQKYDVALRHNITPIICFGETGEDYHAGKTEQVISRLLNTLIEHNGAAALTNTILAYEPIWAIGTGTAASPDWIEHIHYFIRQRIAKHDPVVAESIRIIYGGSVQSVNAQAIFAQPNVDGGLIGGAALDVEEFLHICFAAALKPSLAAND